jgi:hypothetical protein
MSNGGTGFFILYSLSGSEKARYVRKRVLKKAAEQERTPSSPHHM